MRGGRGTAWSPLHPPPPTSIDAARKTVLFQSQFSRDVPVNWCRREAPKDTRGEVENSKTSPRTDTFPRSDGRKIFLSLRGIVINLQIWFYRRILGMEIGNDVRISLRARTRFHQSARRSYRRRHLCRLRFRDFCSRHVAGSPHRYLHREQLLHRRAGDHYAGCPRGRSMHRRLGGSCHEGRARRIDRRREPGESDSFRHPNSEIWNSRRAICRSSSGVK